MGPCGHREFPESNGKIQRVWPEQHCVLRNSARGRTGSRCLLYLYRMTESKGNATGRFFADENPIVMD